MTIPQEIEERFSKNPKSLLFAHLADLYLREGRIDDAVQLCEEGIKYHPYYVTGHYILAKAYLSMGEQDKAETVFKKVLSHDRNYISAHKHLGDIMAHAGWESKAAVHYRDLLRIDPLEPEAREMLRSFSLDEPFQETAFHETVPSRSEHDLKINTQTTSIRRQDWEEEFDELFKIHESKTEENDELHFSDLETDMAKLDETENLDMDESVIDTSSQQEAGQTVDSSDIVEIELPDEDSKASSNLDNSPEEQIETISLDDFDVAEFEKPAVADSPVSIDELGGELDGVVLDVSLDDLDDPEKFHPKVAEPEAKPPNKPKFDEIDLSSFEKLDELFSNEDLPDVTADGNRGTDSTVFDLPGSDSNQITEISLEIPDEDEGIEADQLPESSDTDSGDDTSAEPAVELDLPATDLPDVNSAEKEPDPDIAEIFNPAVSENETSKDIPITETVNIETEETTPDPAKDESALVLKPEPMPKGPEDEAIFGDSIEMGTEIGIAPDKPEEEPRQEISPSLDGWLESDDSETVQEITPEEPPAPVEQVTPEIKPVEPASETESENFSTEDKIISPTLGEIYAAQNQYAKALKVFQTLLASDPGNAHYQNKINEMNKKIEESE